MSTVLLFSGGMDSYIAYFYLQNKNPLEIVTPIYIDYQGKYCKKEMKNIRELLPQTIIIEHIFNFSNSEVGDKCYIPNRNLYLISLAAEYGENVIIGGLKDDNVGDKSEDFCKSLSLSLSLSMEKKVVVDSPFWNMEKVDVIRWFLKEFKYKVDPERYLLKTTSCYDKKEHYCGRCPSCFRKACALNFNGIDLPFSNLDLAKEYLNNINSYSGKRKLSIEQFCEKLGVCK